MNLLLFATNEEALQAVSYGKAFAFIGDLVSTPAMINEFGLKNLKAACPSGLSYHSLAIGIRNDWPELQSILNKSLKAIPVNEKTAIINKWITVRVDYGIRTVDILKWVLLVFGAAVIVIGFFIFWNQTLKRKVEERTVKLSESEKRFRSTFEQAAVGIAHVNPDGQIMRINQKFCDIVGYSNQELKALSFRDITHPDDLEEDNMAVNQLLTGEREWYSIEKRYIRKSEEITWVNLTVSLIRDVEGNPDYFVSVIENIDSRKQMETALRTSEKNLLEAQSLAHLGSWVWDIKANNITWSDELYKIFGLEESTEITYETLLQSIHPDDRDYHTKHTAQWLENKHNDAYIYRIIRPDKLIRYIHAIGKVTWDDKGDAIFMDGIAQDITERRRVEETSRNSAERFKKIFNTSPASITISQLNTGIFTDVNQAFERDFGYTKTEILGNSALGLKIWKNPADRERLMPEYFKKKYLHVSDLELVKKSGEVAIVNAQFSIMPMDGEDHSIAVFLDVTAQKKTENEVLKYQKRLKALASELTLMEEKQRKQIATDLHDHVGQLLALSRLQLAAIHEGMDIKEVIEKLKPISEGLLQSIHSVRSAIFDLSSPQLNEIGLYAAVRDWLEEQVEQKYGIRAQLSGDNQHYPLEENLRFLLFRSIRELLTNVVKHARATDVKVYIKEGKESLSIVVKDNGIGFNYRPQMLQLKTTGFGLFSIQERMEDSGGSMQVQSIPGKGTQIKLIVPLNYT